jgi:hypothetical protein
MKDAQTIRTLRGLITRVRNLQRACRDDEGFVSYNAARDLIGDLEREAGNLEDAISRLEWERERAAKAKGAA